MVGTDEERRWGTLRDDESDDANGPATGAAGSAGDGTVAVEDPTGSGWWRVLAGGTAVAALGFFLWPALDAFLAAGELVAGTPFDASGALFGLAPLLLLLAVRFAVLPVALWRDATLIGGADVGWNPSRRFYMTAGALWASLTCAYYLYKRCRYTGRPDLPIPDERLHFAGREIHSNWHLVIGAGALLVPSLTGFEFLMDAIEGSPAPDVLAAILAMVVVFLAAVGLVFLPIAYYRDTRAVQRADVEWDPNTGLYVVAGYVFALPVAVYYLYRRSQIEDL